MALRRVLIVPSLVAAVAAGAVIANRLLPAAGAGALLHPTRRHVVTTPPESCDHAAFAGAGVRLKGWTCHAAGPRRGTIVYLHGIADNRVSGAGVVRRFRPRGFDVVAYDSRGHGESEGEICTYGFFEKQDLRRVLDTVAPGPIVLFGTSLGAAVALQEAADDPRVTAVVAAETFSSLRAIAMDRAPFFFTRSSIAAAFRLAEAEGHFEADAVSPAAAAEEISAPVLLIHGEADVETRPEHSRRVFAALRGPKRLVIVPGAAHNESLSGTEIWKDIERWIDANTPLAPAFAPPTPASRLRRGHGAATAAKPSHLRTFAPVELP